LTVSVVPGVRVQADPERLARLLGNLVDNAVRHTPPTGVVTITAGMVDEPRLVGPVARLTVSDTGSGIAADRLDRIFERFERGDGTGTTSDATGRSGFGLGLAIVRELVLAHGGTISVTSERGVGTTFTVELPAAK
jgi:signal transduction histidine kinase